MDRVAAASERSNPRRVRRRASQGYPRELRALAWGQHPDHCEITFELRTLVGYDLAHALGDATAAAWALGSPI